MIYFFILLCVSCDALQYKHAQNKEEPVSAGGVTFEEPKEKEEAKQQAPWGDKIEIPDEYKKVLVNIGPNENPIMPEDDKFLILVDPLPSVIDKLKSMFGDKKNVAIYQSAISNYTGTAEFNKLNSKGLSSSLSDPVKKEVWNQGELNGGVIEVAVNTLKDLLKAIPEDKTITYMKTDMQGHDLTAIKSAGDEIKRVKHLQAETYKNGHSSYKGVENEMKDWQEWQKDSGKGFHNTKCKDTWGWEQDCQFWNFR